MKYVMISILVLSIKILYSQFYTNNWYFGDSAAINFDGGEIEFILQSNMQAGEASASISDSSGNLLFYTNSLQVWDKDDNVMPNGNDLAGLSGPYGSSITQGCLIVQQPSSFTEYYLFTLNYLFLYTSVVNMTLNGGFGDVTEEKNIQLSEDEMTEKLNAVKHANGRDWWVIAHSSFGNTYYKYLVTPDGIEGPYLQNIGVETTTKTGRFGEMVFSEQGDKLVSVYNVEILDLYDFDRCTGEISNWVDLRNDEPTTIYGASFSPDGCKLYVSEYSPGKLFQYDICQGDIKASKTLIFKNEDEDFSIGQQQLGPDEKIYITINSPDATMGIYDTLNMNLSVINNPNAVGMACDFDTSTIWLGGNR